MVAAFFGPGAYSGVGHVCVVPKREPRVTSCRRIADHHAISLSPEECPAAHVGESMSGVRTTSVTKAQARARIARIDGQVPALHQELDGFPRACEGMAEVLRGEVFIRDQDFAHGLREEVVASSGYKR